MRKKQIRFAENAKRDNILEPGKDLYTQIKGRWNEVYFKNDHPIVLEIGAGRGEYTVGLAEKYPEKNVVGIDMKGDRLWYGSGESVEKGLTNVAFIRTRIEQIENFFAEGEVSEIWITFPGPRPKKSQANRRLTNQKFLELYKQILQMGGVVHVKSDSELVYSYTLEQLKARKDVQLLTADPDIYKKGEGKGDLSIKTYFEQKFLAKGSKITYIKFQFIERISWWKRCLDGLKRFRYSRRTSDRSSVG